MKVKYIVADRRDLQQKGSDKISLPIISATGSRDQSPGKMNSDKIHLGL